jgi:hypothetical protein
MPAAQTGRTRKEREGFDASLLLGAKGVHIGAHEAQHYGIGEHGDQVFTGDDTQS